jgi:hypothetical protein
LWLSGDFVGHGSLVGAEADSAPRAGFATSLGCAAPLSSHDVGGFCYGTACLPIFGDWACAAPTNTTSRAAAPDATLRIDRPAPADLKCKKPIRLGRFKSRSGAKLRKVGTNSLDTFIADHRAAVRHRPGVVSFSRAGSRGYRIISICRPAASHYFRGNSITRRMGRKLSNRLKSQGYRFSVAPMMDWSESSSFSIG